MKNIIVLGAAALAAVATPAIANEARVEARGGIAWGAGDSEAMLGAAAGYDFDLGGTTFAGVEVSADKILTDHTRVSFGLGGRVGAKISPVGKLYANAAWQSEFCKYCDDSFGIGAGYQHSFGGNLYGKLEYRHLFFDGSDADTAVAGLGVRF